MRIPINLASQPFRHNRAVFIGSGLMAAIMIATLVLLIQLARIDRHSTRDYQRQLIAAEKQLDMIHKDQLVINQELSKPQNSLVLEYSRLLNTILTKKGISWNRIFSDLEKVVPYNVRVLQIRPQLDVKNRILLQMVVGGDTQEHLDAFLGKLEGSDVFGATTVTSIVPPSQTDPIFRYQVSVIYAQKL
jgi:hypothetical protein